MTDRIAELERAIEWRKNAISGGERNLDVYRKDVTEMEAELARLKVEPEWEELDGTELNRRFRGRHVWQWVNRSLVTWIENRAVDRYKRDQADAIGALRAIFEARDNPTTALSFLDALQRGRATLRALDEGKRS